MRLWHIDLIHFLPKTQLIAQWRELNSIFKKQDNHILINYIYNYDKVFLFSYSSVVIKELRKRNIKIRKNANFCDYFCKNNNLMNFNNIDCEYKFIEHDNDYLSICYYNLKEKYIRGQKDFTKEVWEKLDNFYKQRLKGKI